MNKFMEKGLYSILREDLKAHGNDRSKPGYKAIAVCRFGAWRMGIKLKLLRVPFSILYRWMFHRTRNRYGIEIPYTVQLGRRVVFEHQHGIVVHGEAMIGDDCIIRQGVTIGNRYLERPHDAPRLGKNVNVGAGATILGAVSIGDNVNIGSNAVIIEDIPAGATAVAPKARVIIKNES